MLATVTTTLSRIDAQPQAVIVTRQAACSEGVMAVPLWEAAPILPSCFP